MTWKSLGSSFNISSIYTVKTGARSPPEEAKVQGKDLPSKTDAWLALGFQAYDSVLIGYVWLCMVMLDAFWSSKSFKHGKDGTEEGKIMGIIFDDANYETCGH